MNAEVVFGLLFAVVMAALISEVAFRESLTNRGRVVLPIVLGVLAWLGAIAVGLLRLWLAESPR